jgi:deoxyadenosine/deoxycytidine kinase
MLVSIEGNIGSGKSTILQALAAEGYTVQEEPLDEWGPLLDMYYQDPARWSLAMNLKVLHSFHTQYQKYHTHRNTVCIERSPGACRHVFGQLSYNDEHLSPAAWTVFKEYHDILGWEPDAYIYIDTAPEMCYTRKTQRGRPCEDDLTEEYLRRIEFQYTNFLKFVQVPVHTIDGNRPISLVIEDVKQCLDGITSLV